MGFGFLEDLCLEMAAAAAAGVAVVLVCTEMIMRKSTLMKKMRFVFFVYQKQDGECGACSQVALLLQKSYLCSVCWEPGGGTLLAAIRCRTLLFPNLQQQQQQQ
jgi:Zn finger protein HypA/HybF involved in hydrogenase expression